MKEFVLLMLFSVLPLYCIGNNISEDVKLYGNWNETKPGTRNLTPDIPISGKVSNGLLILTNEFPDRDIMFTLADSKGSIIIKKEFPMESSSYMVISLNGLQESETYTVTLTSPYPSDCLTAIINL